MSYVTQYALAFDSVFQQKVMVAMLNIGVAIQGEAVNTTNHTNRANYAKLVMNNPQNYLLAFSQAITAYDAALTQSTADATIQNDVSAVWNALAGTI